MTDSWPALRYESRISHGDVKFVLCDFDLAVLGNKDGTAADTMAHHRTLPFMAINLLEHENMAHRLYHDYKSLFWMVLWCAMTVHNESQPGPEKAKIKTTLDMCETGTHKATAGQKRTHREDIEALPICGPFK
ncbi:hypothetical protein BN946_scf184714.g6 [Trametes cinnabarina]|uniref:Fungal-type protein kinase domain-containing protein n=1 Tax=Pycnoporus cinnabarinus TaxID=5643 RepID=A0A060SUP4_PYCCI|nr:hypothetical protein BN946_scf184714.g6 [Trametes cinnabarina]